MQKTIEYILRFLAGDQIPLKVIRKIGYTSNEDEYARYPVVIKASEFFNHATYGQPTSIPKVPLQQWEETPVLFGEGKVEMINSTLVIHADIVASTFFLISRYEEMVRRNVRDTHGRFPGKESVPYKGGFIDRPIIEEWGILLRQQLRAAGITAEEPTPKIQKVYLTHDVDQMAHFRNIRGMMGGLLRGIKRPKEGQQALRSYFGGLIFDPWYTFPYLYKLDNELRKKLGEKRCEVITFFRAGGGRRREDKPVANLTHPDYKRLISYTKRRKVTIGLHISYEAGCNPELIQEEKKRLDKFTRTKCTYNRNHFLNNREPEDFTHLIENGITDDFSMGYADIAGFRLGTCKPVQWINPKTREVTPLILHSLTIMDVSLSERRYMFMNSHDALQYCESLINTVERYSGEISLLWHNNSVEISATSYHRQLYNDLILFLQTK